MKPLHEYIQSRRKHLGLRQKDMEPLIGMKQAQYNRLEAGGNMQLNTIERVLKVLNLQMVFVPKEKLNLILPLLDDGELSPGIDQPVSLLEQFQVVDD